MDITDLLFMYQYPTPKLFAVHRGDVIEGFFPSGNIGTLIGV